MWRSDINTPVYVKMLCDSSIKKAVRPGRFISHITRLCHQYSGYTPYAVIDGRYIK